MHTERLQTALEYLSVYGWALLIIGVALITLLYLGVFNSNNFISQQCVIANGFSCQSFYMSTNGQLRINLVQSTISPINVTGIGCYQNSTNMELQEPNNYPSNQIYMQIGSNYTFTAQCYNTKGGKFNGTISTAYSGQIAVNYTNAVTGYKELTIGTVVVKISH